MDHLSHLCVKHAHKKTFDGTPAHPALQAQTTAKPLKPASLIPGDLGLKEQIHLPSPFKQIQSMDRVCSVRVYPPIGIARVGSAPLDESWIALEYPRLNPRQSFKFENNHIRRMACRYRVFGFDEHGHPLGEISNNHALIKWNVKLVNSKSAFWKFQNFSSIVNDASGDARETNPAWKSQGFRNPSVQADKLLPSERTDLIVKTEGNVDSSAPGKRVPLAGPLKAFQVDLLPLGTIECCPDGSLLLFPGTGEAGKFGDATLTDDFNTPGYYDTTGDGSIEVEVDFKGKIFKSGKHSSWVLLSPPKFAPDILEAVTMYDGIQSLFDGADFDIDNFDQVWKHKDTLNLEFWKDIYPILRRPCGLAWTNPDAFGGHGPSQPGDFTANSWCDKLSDPTLASAAVRAEVFFRLRNPDQKIAVGQADRRWMPRLSGNGGRCTTGDPTTWTSLTDYQYRVLTQWRDGQFTVGKPNIGDEILLTNARDEAEEKRLAELKTKDKLTPEQFEDLDILEQLKYSIKAFLCSCIGGPVYPGIEASWSYLLRQTYTDPFRINRDVIKPGDLNRYLSCPWQSDFYLCRNHWWPACRPDSVVPQEEYDRVMKLADGKHVHATAFKRTAPWERGLRPQHSDTFADLELTSNVDMIKYWEKLGFVLRQRLNLSAPPENTMDPQYCVYIERERSGFTPIYEVPRTDFDNIIKTLWGLMRFEFSTVPLYLYAAWSIKSGDGEYGPFQIATNDGLGPKQLAEGQALRRSILRIVSEEMLHLSLVGNILVSLGAKDVIQLSSKEAMPSYPSVLPLHGAGWNVNLAPLHADQLEAFIEIEKPAPRYAVASMSENQSIAQSYAYVLGALQKACETPEAEKAVFKGDQESQFAPGEVYSPRTQDAGGCIKVNNLETFKKAVDTITVQGEGAIEDITYSPYVDKLKEELSHYARFKAARDDIKNGKVQIWNMPNNPGNLKLPNGLKAVNDLFNGVYRYLLKTIDILYTEPIEAKRKTLIWTCMFPAMTSVLPSVAEILIRQKLPEGTQAAPTFSYYEFPAKGCWTEHIQKNLLENAIQANVEHGQVLERLAMVKVPIMNLGKLDFAPPKPPQKCEARVIYKK